MMGSRRLPIRTRLAAAASAATAIVLVAAGLAVFGITRHQIDASIDESLAARIALARGLAAEGNGSLTEMREPANADGALVAQVVDAHGRVLDRSANAGFRAMLTPQQAERAVRSALTFDSAQALDGPVRVAARPTAYGDTPAAVVVAVSLEERDQTLAGLRTGLIAALSAAILLISAGAWLFARAALLPIRGLARSADRIMGSDDGRRLDGGDAQDELAELAKTLNQMLDRIAASAVRERRFVADASHELRTPLALIRGEIEVSLLEDLDRDGHRERLLALLGDVDRLQELVDDLLMLARADERRLEPVRVETRARDLAERLRRRFTTRAVTTGRSIDLAVADDVVLDVDAGLLEHALVNLVENAYRHGAGPVRVVIEGEGEGVLVAVRDGGPGPEAAFRPIAFERFSRADTARSDSGSGLGLAIVQLVAEVHGGTTVLRVGTGNCTIGMLLPRTARV